MRLLLSAITEFAAATYAVAAFDAGAFAALLALSRRFPGVCVWAGQWVGWLVYLHLHPFASPKEFILFCFRSSSFLALFWSVLSYLFCVVLFGCFAFVRSGYMQPGGF